MSSYDTSIFVTSTGTEVGKTVVSVLLIRLLRARVDSLGYYKPVASDCDDTIYGYRSPDEAAVIEGGRLPLEDVHADQRFDAPLSPDQAAAREGRSVDVPSAVERHEELMDRYDSLVVEGIGGVAVPLTPDRDVADLAARLGLPVVLVVSSGLGTISHTRTAVEHLRAAGAPPAGLILTPARGEEIETINLDHLRELYPDRPVELLPTFDPQNDDLGESARVGEQFLQSLGLIH